MKPKYATDAHTDADFAQVLRQFNAWRRFDGDPDDEGAPPQPCPYVIGKAIDAAIKSLERAA